MSRLVLGEDLSARFLEISPKSYRPVPGGQRGGAKRRDPIPEGPRRDDDWPPRPRAVRVVERGEDLGPARVDHREPEAATGVGVLGDAARQGVQG